MFRFIMDFYYKYISSRLYRKNLLIYLLISNIPILLLSFFISDTIADKLQEKEIHQVELITYNLNNYLDQKYESFYNLIHQTYSQKTYSPEIFNFIETRVPESTRLFYDFKQEFINYLNLIFSYDSDLQNAVLYKHIDKSIFALNKESIEYYSQKSEYETVYENHLLLDKPSLKILPCRYPEYNKEQLIYSIAINLKILGTNVNSAILQLDYLPEGFKRIINQMYDGNFPGEVFIHSPQGGLIFDSSGKYSGLPDQIINNLDEQTVFKKYLGNEYLVSSTSQNKLDLHVTYVIPSKLIFKERDSIRMQIYLTSMICVIVIIVLTQYNTATFSKRVQTITIAMNQVKHGDLDSRIDTKSNGDELNDIGINFNQMCLELSEYIKKEYLYELTIKKAELSALQTQINPHFIYNTLEAIRMSAISGGETRTSNMIYILAKMFRNNVRKKDIISIEEEMSQVKMYLELFKIRFGENFFYDFKISDTIKNLGIPKNLIQPLIENYIVHGYDLKKKKNLITITAEIKHCIIVFSIEDNGLGIAKNRLVEINRQLHASDTVKKDHIGIKNVHDRIKLIYGPQYGLWIESQENWQTSVILKIAAKSVAELENERINNCNG